MLQTPFTTANSDDSPILFPVALRQVGWRKRDGNYDPIVGNRAIVRLNGQGNDAYALSVVSSTYKLVTNRELFTTVEDAMIEYLPSAVISTVDVTDRVSHFGKTCYRTYVFPDMRCNIGAKSDIAFRVIVQNGYGGSALKLLSGAIEFYCANGMVRGEYEQAYHRHTQGLRIDRLGQVLRHSIDAFWSGADELRRWTQTLVTREQTMNLFHELANTERLYDALMGQWAIERDERGSNAYSVYSAMTFYASHNDGDFASRAQEDTVAFNMVHRETSVAKWIESPQWRALVDA